jgi:hypothetical protein
MRWITPSKSAPSTLITTVENRKGSLVPAERFCRCPTGFAEAKECREHADEAERQHDPQPKPGSEPSDILRSSSWGSRDSRRAVVVQATEHARHLGTVRTWRQLTR